MDTDAGGVFSSFYSVVLEHANGGPLRWSSSKHSWLRRVGEGWMSTPVEGDVVREDQLWTAASLAGDFLESASCDKCHRESDPAMHFIAPDVSDTPAIYCVQLPSFEVVDSPGGAGVYKHWGSHDACSVVRPKLQYARLAGVGGNSVVAAGYVFGRPLIADEVLERDWCSRCRTYAHRVLGNAKSESRAVDDHYRSVRLLSIELRNISD